MRLQYILLVLLALAIPGRAQVVKDTYGGIISYNGVTAPTCTPGTEVDESATWAMRKVGDRWWFCTPEGHIWHANGANPVLGGPASTGQSAIDCQTNAFNSTGGTLTWTLDPSNPAGKYIYNATGISWTVYRVYKDTLYGGDPGSLPGSLTKCASCTSGNYLTTMTAGSWYQDGTTLHVWMPDSDSPGEHSVMNYPQRVINILIAKYGSTNPAVCPNPSGNLDCYNWAWQQEKRIGHYGFNSIFQQANPFLSADMQCTATDTANGTCKWATDGLHDGTNPIKYPYSVQFSLTRYSSIKRFNYTAQAVKGIEQGMNGISGSYGGGYSNWLVDSFDPLFKLYLEKDLGQQNGFDSIKAHSKWIFSVSVDDSDQFYGSGCGDMFCGGDPNHPGTNPQNNANPGFITLIASPVQTFSPQGWRAYPQVYYGGAGNYEDDTRSWSKASCQNWNGTTKTCGTAPLANTCSVEHPCSLRDSLWQKYTNNGALSDAAGIAALNTAWGSSYTGFDSTGVKTAGESISGSGTRYNATLANTPISPMSVLVSVGGTPKIGDCPSYHVKACASPTPAGFGSLECGVSGANNEGSCSDLVKGYAIASISGNGTTVTVTTTAANALQTGQYVTINRTGYNDKFGPITVDSATQFHFSSSITTACSSGCGYATSNFIKYATGEMQLLFAVAPGALTATYIHNGWGAGGTGLMDEDGSGTHYWTGAGNHYCLVGADPDPNYAPYFACRKTSPSDTTGSLYLPRTAFRILDTAVSGGTVTFTIANAVYGSGYTLHNGQTVKVTGNAVAACDGTYTGISNAGDTALTFSATAKAGCTSNTTDQGWVNNQSAVDAQAWIAQLSANYFKTIQTALKTPNAYGWPGTNIPYIGLDDSGSWDAPPHKEFLWGQALYSDAVFIGGLRADLPSPAGFQAYYRYISEHYGDKPVLIFQFPYAANDSAWQCNTQTAYGSDPTQEVAAQNQYDTINYLLTHPSYWGTYQYVGQNSWSWQDFDKLNQGIISAHDNAYDGIEAKKAEVDCETGVYDVLPGAKCGKEPGVPPASGGKEFGSAMPTLLDGNRLWLPLTTGGGSAPSSVSTTMKGVTAKGVVVK